MHTNLTSNITPLPGLKHLVVRNAGRGTESLAQVLPLFMSLETLSLSNHRASQAYSCRLHLDGLQQLRSVALDKMLLCGIRLRKGCELHVNTTGTLLP